jgi:hypothetical protein
MALYKLMRKPNTFICYDEFDASLVAIKRMLSEAPILAPPKDKEPMLLYTVAANLIINIIMVVKWPEEGSEYLVQRSVYYISEVFSDFKQIYP